MNYIMTRITNLLFSGSVKNVINELIKEAVKHIILLKYFIKAFK